MRQGWSTERNNAQRKKDTQLQVEHASSYKTRHSMCYDISVTMWKHASALCRGQFTGKKSHRLIRIRVEIIHISHAVIPPSPPYSAGLIDAHSKGLVWVPHHVRNRERPTVSKTRARAPTATVSRGLFSVKTWAMNCLKNQQIVQIIQIITNCRGPARVIGISEYLQKEQMRPWRSRIQDTRLPCRRECRWRWWEPQLRMIGRHCQRGRCPRLRQPKQPPLTWQTPPWNLRLERGGRCHRRRGQERRGMLRGWRWFPMR